MSWYRSDDANNLILTLRIQTGAKRTEAAGLHVHGDALKIKLAALPIEDRANAALLKFLAKSFGVPRCQVTLKQGAKSQFKVIEIRQPARSPDVLLKK